MPVSWQTRFFSVLGHGDVAEDRLQDALAGHGRLSARRVGERVAEILRDVLQRPDVEMRCGVRDRRVEIRRHDAHDVDLCRLEQLENGPRIRATCARVLDERDAVRSERVVHLGKVREHGTDDVEVAEHCRREEIEPRSMLQ